MKIAAWVLPALMLLAAAENLYWDHVYGDFATVCYPVMGLLFLGGIGLGVRLHKTGKKSLLLGLILVFVLFLAIAVFRTELQEAYRDMTAVLEEIKDGGCWKVPTQPRWN